MKERCGLEICATDFTIKEHVLSTSISTQIPSRINLNHLQVVLVGFLERVLYVLFDVKLRETRVNCTTKLLLQKKMSNYLHQVCFHNYGRLY